MIGKRIIVKDKKKPEQTRNDVWSRTEDCAGPCIGSQRKSIDLRLGIETKGHRRGYFIHLPDRDRTKEVRFFVYLWVLHSNVCSCKIPCTVAGWVQVGL